MACVETWSQKTFRTQKEVNFSVNFTLDKNTRYRAKA